MKIRAKDIVHENGRRWVLDSPAAYVVMTAGLTHSTSDSAYTRDPDGLSIAVARCDYLARRDEERAGK